MVKELSRSDSSVQPSGLPGSLQKGQVTSESTSPIRRSVTETHRGRVFKGRERHRQAFALMKCLLSNDEEDSAASDTRVHCQRLNELKRGRRHGQPTASVQP